MAVNESRSLNHDLLEGLTDGIVKKLAPNRGGTPNDFHAAQVVYDGLARDLYDPSFQIGYDVAARQTTVHG